MSTQSSQHQPESAIQQSAEPAHQGFTFRKLAPNPFPHYRQMREQHPVAYSQESKAWEVFRYDDIQIIVNNPTLFSSEQVITNEAIAERRRKRREQGFDEDEEFGRSLINADPPRHRQLRSLITQAFTPRTIAQLAPRISDIVHEQLDKIADNGAMDVIADLSYPLPVTVIAEMLGIPSTDRAQFKRWSDAVISDEEDEAIAAGHEMNRYFKGILEQRRKQSGTDLISELIATDIEGEKLTEPELLSFCVLLLVAGNITTTNLIGNAILCFDEHPEVMDEIRAEPALLPGAIEEVLRYRSPVQLLIRAVTRDTVLGGQQLKAGDLVLPNLGSANRDETQFPDPDRFDIHRNPNRHVAFGHGIHFCIGAPLARLEAKIALEIMLARFDNIKRDTSIPMEPVPSTFIYSVKNLPITFRNA
ncbi:MAG TPA: cytochrome P450 [Ktedonobacteraceae bacterium]